MTPPTKDLTMTDEDIQAAIEAAVLSERRRCVKAVQSGPFPLLAEVIIERIEKPDPQPWRFPLSA